MELDTDVMPGLKRQPTLIGNRELPSSIKTFLDKLYHIEHYQVLAKSVKDILEDELRSGGVRHFKLSSRAKDRYSLEEKLMMRYDVCQYENEEDIKKDIVDLAGVRIILYMPTADEYEKVTKVIRRNWGEDIEPKTHPPTKTECSEADPSKDMNKKKEKYQPRHLGYRAIHYRVPIDEKVPMKEGYGKGYHYKELDQVEIQVVSALTHAWAEVGHDILYKTHAYGPPTLQEERILDALNGLVQSGDLLLEQFQDMVNKRTITRFKHREELTLFFRDFHTTEMEELGDDTEDYNKLEARAEGIYVLFKFLVMQDKNYPNAVRKALKELEYPSAFVRKEQCDIQIFKGKPQIVFEMMMVVCLIRHLLQERSYQPPVANFTMSEQCSIMISALTMLQFSLGDPPIANKYLLDAQLDDDQITCMNFVLNSSKRLLALEGQREDNNVETLLQGAWAWFRTEAADSTSLCGLLFRLAEMGCRKEADPYIQLDQLRIDQLSRSST